MIISGRKYDIIEPNREQQSLFQPFQPRKDSSFYTKDKRDYSALLNSMKGKKSKKTTK